MASWVTINTHTLSPSYSVLRLPVCLGGWISACLVVFILIGCLCHHDTRAIVIRYCTEKGRMPHLCIYTHAFIYEYNDLRHIDSYWLIVRLTNCQFVCMYGHIYVCVCECERVHVLPPVNTQVSGEVFLRWRLLRRPYGAGSADNNNNNNDNNDDDNGRLGCVINHELMRWLRVVEGY